jgi:hypothetical protein
MNSRRRVNSTVMLLFALPPISAMKNQLQLAVCLILISVATSNCSRHAMTGEQMEQIMIAEVPVGSDASRVIAFLDGRHIDHHSGIVQLDQDERPDTLFSNPRLDSVRDRIRSYIPAILRDVGGPGFLTRWDIMIRFYLDADGKVVAHQAKTIGTSF